MKKEYSFILIAYIAMQLLGFVGLKVITAINIAIGMETVQAQMLAIPIWLVGSFTITLIITLFFLRSEINDYFSNRLNRDSTNLTTLIFWSIGGVFLALFSQSFAIQIELMLGIKPGSDNTAAIINIIQAFPVVIIVTSVVGPILEEIVFRKIIFGTLYKRLNFFLAALISSIIFAVAHNDLEHTLLYTAMGLVFAFLYVKTKRIIVPIISHVAMNTIVVLVQSIYYDDLQELIKQFESIQFIFGGL